jgi:hypothetical protein
MSIDIVQITAYFTKSKYIDCKQLRLSLPSNL